MTRRRQTRREFSDRTSPYIDDELFLEPFAESQGKYIMRCELASGSTARVFLAIYQGTDGLERPVAVKCIHPHLARSPDFMEMFFDEARIAALVEHVSVCRLFDFGRLSDGFFLAMEYVIGEPLTAVIKKLATAPKGFDAERLPRLAARIVANVCEGLHAAHEVRGVDGESLHIVHRDVTPRNIFVVYDGSVRLMDFGIARCRERLHETSIGAYKGTLAYSAPEQIRGGEVDRRVDIWSIGVVLNELLTRRRLFDGSDVAAVTRAVCERPFVAPSRVDPRVPQALDDIVARALCRDPRSRYRTARELALDLEDFLSEQHDSVPAADVAGWLDQMFPGQAAERRAWLARAGRQRVVSGPQLTEAGEEAAAAGRLVPTVPDHRSRR